MPSRARMIIQRNNWISSGSLIGPKIMVQKIFEIYTKVIKSSVFQNSSVMYMVVGEKGQNRFGP